MAVSRRTRRRLILLAVLILATVGVGVAAKLLLNHRRVMAAEAARSAGLEAYEQGQYPIVLEKLGPLLRQNPDDLTLLRAVAYARARLEEPDESHVPVAAALFQKIVELDDSDVEARRELLELYPTLGFLRETLDTADTILAIAPGDPDAMSTRVRVLAAMGRWSEASEEATALVAADPNSEQWKQLQVTTALAGGATADEVIELARSWPPSEPPDGLDDMVIAALLALNGQSEAAFDLAESAIAQGAGNGQRLAAMLSILEDLGLFSESERLIRSYSRQGDVSDAEFARVASTWALSSSRVDVLGELLEQASEGSEAEAEYLTSLALLSLGSSGADRQSWIDRLGRSSSEGSEPDRVKQAILAADQIGRGVGVGEVVRVLEQAQESQASLRELLAASFAAASIGDGESAARFATRAESMTRTLTGGILLVEGLYRSGEVIAAVEAAISAIARYPNRAEPAVVLLGLWADAGKLPTSTVGRIQEVVGVSQPLQLADRLIEVVGLDPLLADALVAASLSQSSVERIEDVVVMLLAADPTPVDAMLKVHRRISPLAPELAALLRQRLFEVAASDPRVMVLSIEGNSVDLAAWSRLREALPLDDADSSRRGEAWRALLAQAGPLSDSDFRNLAGDAIESVPDDVSLAAQILYDDRTWRDAEFSRAAVDRMKRLRGATSRDYVIARANWIMLHGGEDQRERAEALSALNDLYLADPGSFVVAGTLLRMMIEDPAADPQVSIRLGRQLIASRPGAAEIYPVVISLMQSQGMLGEAERLLEEFEAIDGAGAASARQRVLSDFRSGNLDALARSLLRLSEASGEGRDSLNLGMAREATGDLAGAESAYRSALADERASAEAMLRLGRLLRRIGRLDEFERLLESNGGALSDLQREIALAELMFTGGNVQGAIAQLRSATERHGEDPEAWIALALSCSAAGEVTAAGEAAVRGLMVEPTSTELQTIAMAASIEDGAWAEAAILGSDRQGRLPAILVEGVRLLREARGANGRLAPDAVQLRASKELCGRFGDSINAWRLASAMHQAAGQAAESRSIAEAAARRFPDSPDPIEWQVIAATSAGDLDQAVSRCIEWRRLSFPEVRRVDETQAAIELARSRPDLALPLLSRHRDQIVNDATSRPGPYRALIASLIMTGRVREAADIERTNLLVSAQSRDTWAQLAALAPYEQGLEAMSVLESATPPGAADRALLIGRWVAFHERHPSGRGLDRARSLLPAVMPVPNDSDSRMAIVAMADVQRAAGDVSGSRDSLKSVIDSYPADTQERAKTLGSLTGPEQSMLFSEIEPLLYARNNLAMLFIRESQSLDQAELLVTQCLEILPGTPELRDTEAQVLMRLGRLSEAEQSAVFAIRADPLNPSMLITGAEILVASDRLDDAKLLLQRIREILAREPWPSREVEGRLSRLAQLVDSQG